MRKLDRTAATTPPCLANYKHGQHNWDVISAEDKAQIRVSLEQMQGRRCAYCEGDLGALGQHIEHFRRKGKFPALTFDWTNLFWSCDRADSCGHYKDHGADLYDVADLIDPCCDDPDQFFRFRSNGTIDIRAGLTADQYRRASETLRVFGLDGEWGRLRRMRHQAVVGYLTDVEDAAEAGFTPEELKAYFQETLQIAATLPFSTTIRHVLTEGL